MAIAAESAPPDKATSVARIVSGASGPPVSDRHPVRVARTQAAARQAESLDCVRPSTHDRIAGGPIPIVIRLGMVRTAQLETQPDRVPSDAQGTPASEAWLPNVLLAAAVVLLIVVVLGKSRRSAIAKSREILPTPQERLADLRQRAANDTGIESRVAEAADQIRELTAVLDTRIATLDVLIQQADERIDRLNATVLQKREAPANGAAHEASSTTADGQKRSIYELADQGLTPSEIAARLGQHAGKVELILALRRV